MAGLKGVLSNGTGAVAANLKAIEERLTALESKSTVVSMDETELAFGNVVEAVGIPGYVDEDKIADYSAYDLTETGWYIFAKITAKAGTVVTAATKVTGAAGYAAIAGDDHIAVAVRFEVASMSQAVVVNWGDYVDTFIFKATDLGMRNLDRLTTFYVYDIASFTTWEYTLTTDTNFVEGKNYYTKGDDDVYTLAEVTTGDTVPANTYYVHSKVRFEGMARNVTYRCDTIIDCPMEFVLPAIEDETHGAWFEIRCRHAGAYSMTLVPSEEGVKIATEHTQKETAGINMINLHYTVVDGVKIWRFMNTHSTIPE